MMIRGTKKDLLYELRFMADILEDECRELKLRELRPNSIPLMEAIQNKLRHLADSIESGELGRLQDYPTK